VKAGAKIWRTTDGRHVADGHPDAAQLAYAASDDCPDHIVREAYPPAPEPEPVVQEPVEEKAAAKAPNKGSRPAANKGKAD
jgi:hypothetical protein